MTNDNQDITKRSLGRQESEFLTAVGPRGLFTSREAEHLLQEPARKHVRQFLARLERKGWIARVMPGLFAVVPLASGTIRTPQIHEFVVAMELVKPAAIAFFSAMNYHGFTEQIPSDVYIVTDHKISRTSRAALGVSYRIVSLKPERFFGLDNQWIEASQFSITDPEKTIIDGLLYPHHVGGLGTVVQALAKGWSTIDEKKLHRYAIQIGVAAVAKRLGYLQQELGVGDPAALSFLAGPKSGYSRLDPTLPAVGFYNRRWGVLVNVRVRT